MKGIQGTRLYISQMLTQCVTGTVPELLISVKGYPGLNAGIEHQKFKDLAYRYVYYSEQDISSSCFYGVSELYHSSRVGFFMVTGRSVPFQIKLTSKS